MGKLFKMFLVLVVLTTFASAWGFKKGDTFYWYEHRAIKITDVKLDGKIAVSKFYMGEKEGWCIVIFKKIEIQEHVYSIISFTSQTSESRYWIEEVKEGSFYNTGWDIRNNKEGYYPYRYYLNHDIIRFKKL